MCWRAQAAHYRDRNQCTARRDCVEFAIEGYSAGIVFGISAVCCSSPDHAGKDGFQRLTFELRRDRRQGARPGPVKMYRVPPARAWWLAVGPRLERGVRR